jgi:very-short-patch-repair endonuclease
MSSAEVREKSKINSSKEQRKHWVKSLSWLMGYDENGNWICKCPHPDCNRCNEKFYIIPNDVCNQRFKYKTEPCTRILPVGRYTRLNTCEIFIADILKEVGIKPKSDRSILNGYELDFYIPDHNLAIEVNGCWWHSATVKSTNYHFNKFKNCQSQHIQLMQIWEDWIKTKPEIVRSMILNKLGFSERLWARKCKIVELKSATGFLDKNHIQGQTPAAIKLGLTYNDELVSVMCFNKRSKLSGSKVINEDEWELVRFCNKLNTSVVGAAGKLLKHFINKHHPQLITSFSLNDISDGNLYKKLGFKQCSHSSSYWYVNKYTYQRFHRSAFTKKRIKELGLAPGKDNWTEREAMAHSAYYRIQDSGMTKWVLNIII